MPRVCLRPAHGRPAEELLQRAQVALEEADDALERCLYRAGQEGEHRRRLMLITDLRSAIDQDALTLVYQPKVTMVSRSVTEPGGAGALDAPAPGRRVAGGVRAARRGHRRARAG